MSKHNHDHKHDHEHVECKRLLSSLGEYVDGTLGSELCSDIERHMVGCKRCRVVVDTLKKTIELYQEAAEETEMPEEVRQRLFARLELEDYLK